MRIALGGMLLACFAFPARAQSPNTGPAWHFLPAGLLYESYTAGEKESRLGAALLFAAHGATYVDGALGGRLGIVRRAGREVDSEDGWQLDLEGAAFPRVNMRHRRVESTDYRFGFPVTSRWGPVAFKFGYAHVSAHVGDEFLKANPGFVRVNYVRDSFVSGVAYRPTPGLLTYAEAAYAFYVSGGAEPWELQFGAEYGSAAPGASGGLFFAANGHLREEVDFGGSINVIAGWEWHDPRFDRRLRLGAQYFRGRSSQYSFFTDREELVGAQIQLVY